jgi:hypothetical protein
MASRPDVYARPIALIAAILVAVTALFGVGASAASASGMTFTTHGVSVSGTIKVGHTVGIVMKTWSPKPTLTTYQWLENGSIVLGATASKYPLTVADYGKSLSVEVTGVRLGYATAVVESTPTTVGAGSFAKVGTPKISGKAKVDQTLTATTGTWAPIPSSVAYQWKRGKDAISGATGSAYVVQSSDAGKTIRVAVTATLTAYATTTSDSANTPAVTVTTAIAKDGTHLIGGTGLAPGTYVTTSSKLTSCYWVRDDSNKHIIAYDFVSGQAIVTVLNTDHSLVTVGCGKWIRLADASWDPKSTITDGIYAVNQQLTPGTWTAAKAGKKCYWARLSGFLGTDVVHEVIDSGDGAKPVVTIQGSDVGFESDLCGTWTMVSH